MAPEGLLIGSIVASTDVAAIFALLRGSGLRPRVAHVLEGEAGSNDPVAILLVIGFIEWISRPDYGVAEMLALFVAQVGIGVAVGVAAGWLAVRAPRAVRLPTVGLYPVAALIARAHELAALGYLHMALQEPLGTGFGSAVKILASRRPRTAGTA